ncbi:acyl-homoserine-lactone synthase [Jannaschia donghaensis]|uniref:Acyl-homoserine-lactone synthase n=1 Tax=Jannaschia donghaensis TaxID=420998 RepID=A0A0M6YF45_9RHOB|nr:acyl-homoserine-lactone synthase [Jannaschia donghaensis]CTQ48982.1 Acyl-homoserine-lactone synthase [Jannaschia donghaensis]
MIRYLYGTQLGEFPDLAAAMFRDRTAQFRDRMGWDVTVDTLGWETDDYDALDPLYVIACDAGGGHAGSMRFLPTTGPTMLADVFPNLLPAPVCDADTWECTRFCLSPGADTDVARRLLVAASELGLSLGLRAALAVFDAPMDRVYRRLGWAPRVLGTAGGISAGRWTFGAARHDALCAAANVTATQSRDWWDVTFGDLSIVPLPVRA